jgi:hypothetical protein
LNPSETAEQQNITDGDDLIWQPIPLTDDQMLTSLVALTVRQGKTEVALSEMRAIVLERRDFRQRDRALWFILTTFAALLSVSMGMLVADSLGAWGLVLTEFVRNSLVASVVGEVAGLVAIAFRFVFHMPSQTR